MSPSTAELNSATDRAEMRAQLEALQQDFREHASDDKSALREIRDTLRGLKRLSHQARFLGMLTVLGLGAGMAVGKWVLNHYIADQIRIVEGK